MVNISKHQFLWSGAFLFPCILMLTGCPGPGDRMRFDETAQVNVVGDKVCFSVTDPLDYRPADIAINPRGTPSKNKAFTFDPDLTVTEGELCIPPSFYRFPDKGQFIVEYVLTSQHHKNEPRKVVVTFESKNGRIYNVPPNNMEISRPYGEVSKP